MYKVLIIDDIPLVRDAIRLLGQWDLFGITEIFEAGNALEGCEIIHREAPDIIITDMKMPVMDGTQLLKQLEDHHIKSKIIIISGYSDFKYMKLALQSKVIDYILKPIDPQDLNNALSIAVSEIESGQPPVQALEKDESTATSNQLINEITAFVNRHYMSDITLTELADKFFLSKEHLSRMFKKETGVNLFSYIMKLKLEKGKLLLTETNLTLEEIAQKLGFSTGNYFSKVFKKNTGLSPRDYRSSGSK